MNAYRCCKEFCYELWWKRWINLVKIFLKWFWKLWIGLVLILNILGLIGASLNGDSVLDIVNYLQETYSPFNVWTHTLNLILLAPAFVAYRWENRLQHRGEQGVIKGDWRNSGHHPQLAGPCLFLFIVCSSVRGPTIPTLFPKTTPDSGRVHRVDVVVIQYFFVHVSGCVCCRLFNFGRGDPLSWINVAWVGRGICLATPR